MLSWCWACLSLIANLDWNRVQMSSKLNADYFHVMLMFVIWIKRSPNAKFNESITSFSRFQKGIWNVEFLNPRQIFKLNVTVNAKYIWIWIINLLNECFMTPFSYWGSLRLYLKTNDDFFFALRQFWGSPQNFFFNPMLQFCIWRWWCYSPLEF